MLRAAILFLLIAVLSGCESEEHKLDRLKTEESVTALEVFAYQRQLDSIQSAGGRSGDSAVYDSISTLHHEAELKHDLSQRNLRRFLSE